MKRIIDDIEIALFFPKRASGMGTDAITTLEFFKMRTAINTLATFLQGVFYREEIFNTSDLLRNINIVYTTSCDFINDVVYNGLMFEDGNGLFEMTISKKDRVVNIQSEHFKLYNAVTELSYLSSSLFILMLIEDDSNYSMLTNSGYTLVTENSKTNYIKFLTKLVKKLTVGN